MTGHWQVSIIFLTFLHQRKKGLINAMQINGPQATWSTEMYYDTRSRAP